MRTRRRLARRRLLGGALGIAVAAGGEVGAAAPPLVAAAADLQFALDEIARRFEREAGPSVRLVFGSSGNFARQIRQGAPFELFLSADEDYVFALARDGFTRDEGTLYAIGRIVLLVPEGSPLLPDGSLEDLARAVADGRLRRFAIANPEHAPYGKRAEEALRHKGIWEAIRPSLVYGENVAQAARFATSGNAQGGIVAYSLALAPELRAVATHAPIPAEWHAPLRQRMVLARHATPVAERFYAFLQEEPARAIFRRWGFLLPGETRTD
ncbi:MAG: molybdate ABC transporter substrate-binding protein [Geminicoccaceae bacterium]|nr:molybdate ABC transporter substrate-binding protein [Geminicoccaceae bacterium]MCX8101491.1 molybdate ABC transporter substrate-binding protein [Geminicoccaceae bacterium]MDW8371063.1 molybdate ABC transporter substrate-binding protein [Geminicoccaceae bacterium]